MIVTSWLKHVDGQKETTYTKLNQSRGINCLYEFANPSDPKKNTFRSCFKQLRFG